MATIGTAEVDVKGDWSGFEKDSKSKLGRMGNMLGMTLGTGIGTFAGGLALKGIQAIGSALLAVGKDALKFAGDLQTAREAWTVSLEGGAAAADDMLGFIKEVAVTTPFEVQPIVEATRKMTGFGIESERVQALMGPVLDAVAAFGGSGEEIGRVGLALGQVQAKGRVLGEELRQLNEAGVNAQSALADYLGMSIPEVIEAARAGEISVDDLFNSIEQRKGTLGDVEGAAKALSHTFVGAFSNIKDAARFGLVEGMQPALDDLTTTMEDDLLPAVNKATPAIGRGFGDAISGFAKLVKPLIGPLSKVAEAIGDVMGRFVTGLMPVIETLMPFMNRFAGQFTKIASSAILLVMPILEIAGLLGKTFMAALTAVAPLFGIIGGVIKTLVPIFKQWYGAIEEIVAIIAPALIPIIEILGEFLQTGLTMALKFLLPPLITLAEGIVTLVAAIAPLLAIVGDLIIALLPIVGVILQPLADIIALVATVIVEALVIGFIALIEAVMPLVPPLLNLVKQVLPPLSRLLSLVAIVLSDVLLAAFELLIPMITPFVDILVTLLPVVSTLAGFLLDLAVKAIKNLVIPAIRWLIDMLGKWIEPIVFVMETIAELVDYIVENWDAIWTEAGEIVDEIWNNIKTWIEDAWNTIVAFFDPAKVTEPWNRMWNTVSTKASEIWDTIKTTVDTAITNIVNWFTNLPGRIGTAAANVWSKVKSVGKDIVEGVWEGISNAVEWFKSKVTAFFGNIVDNVKDFLGIGSPSKAFADIGKEMVRGMEQGIAKRGRKDLVASNLIALVPGSLNAGATYGQYGMAGAFGGAGGPLINNNFYAPVGGSMSEFAREVMTEAALEVRFYGAA